MKPSNDREAITLIVDGLLEKGVTLRYVDDTMENVPVSETIDAVGAITAVDEAVLYVTLPNGKGSHIFFVLGNSPEEVACDYGVSLSDYIEPIVNPWWE